MGNQKLLAKRLERLIKEKPELFTDYRLLTGKFDKIVSAEMIEAVGHKYFSTYFSKISRLLKPNGIAGIQAIVIPDHKYDQYQKKCGLDTDTHLSRRIIAICF